MVELWLFIIFLLGILFYLGRSTKAIAPQFLQCNRSCQRYLFRILWDAGYFPEVNYRVGSHNVDIAFPYSKVALECGWNKWESNDIVRYAAKRKQRELAEQGWKFINLSPEEIYGRSKWCVNKVQKEVSMVEQHIF